MRNYDLTISDFSMKKERSAKRRPDSADTRTLMLLIRQVDMENGILRFQHACGSEMRAQTHAHWEMLSL